MNLKIEDIVDKVYNKKSIAYEEFICLIKNGYEIQFYYGKRKFGSTQFEGYEFYEWDKEEGYQCYQTIEEFKQKINIDGKSVFALWNEIKKVDFAE